jgi:hypothetical protein
MLHISDLMRREYNEEDYLFIEHVHAYPKQGVSSTFAFGLSTGALYGVIAVTTRQIPYRVTPASWKRFHGLLKVEKVETLNLMRSTLGDVWDVPPTDTPNGLTGAIACADAIGIALYGRNLVQRGMTE